MYKYWEFWNFAIVQATNMAKSVDLPDPGGTFMFNALHFIRATNVSSLAIVMKWDSRHVGLEITNGFPVAKGKNVCTNSKNDPNNSAFNSSTSSLFLAGEDIIVNQSFDFRFVM